MTTIAGDAIAAVLAAAKIDRLGFLGFVFLRREFASLVRAITEGLGRALATGTEPVAFTFFYFNCIRALLGNDGLGLGHDFSLNNGGLK